MEDEGEESIENLEDTKGNTARVWVQLAAPRREIKYRWGIKKSYLFFFLFVNVLLIGHLCVILPNLLT